MSLYVENNGGDFERCPVGVHMARCFRIVDLGTQKKEYLGQLKMLHQVMIAWEIFVFDERGKPTLTTDGKPFQIFKNYTLAWSDKANLRKDLQSWRGKPFTEDELKRFDLKNVLGAWCLLSVIERKGANNNKVYANADTIMPLPSSMKSNLPESVNKNELFSIDEADMEMFDRFSENLKGKIGSSPEWIRLHGDNYSPTANYQKDKAESDKHQINRPAPKFEEEDDIPF